MSKKSTSNHSKTDFDRLRNLKDSEIDFSDISKITPEQFAKAIVRKGLKPVLNKHQLTLRIDQEIVNWFKNQGRGYQTKINQILKAYVEAHQQIKTTK
jgi:uncharacterized protein (DUF4415 family)